jgi:Tol biopolymer transport system component
MLLGLAKSYAQPLIRQTNDISLIGAPNLPGMLGVTLERGTAQVIRYIDLEDHKVLEFPSPVSNAGYPFFSPTGDSVAFVGITRRGPEIFTSGWAGGNVQRITFNSVLDGNPSWSPTGDEVIYFSENRKYKSEIFSSLITAPFSRTQLTKVGGGNTTPRESADGRYLLYTTDRYAPAWNICLIDQSSKKESCPMRGGNSSNCRAQWSPDGSQFVFTLERGPSVDLYLYTVTTRKMAQLTSLSHKEYDATWSPDGEYIAFAHDPKGTLKFDIKVVRLRDRAIIPVAKASGSLRYLSWSSARPYSIAADLCPEDPNKSKPGNCGCGSPDADLDNDSVPDCIDGCPNNRKKHRALSCN